MAATILTCPVSDSRKLELFLEDHVARPTYGRLLVLNGHHVNDLDEPRGTIEWRLFFCGGGRRTNNPVRLAYEVSPMPVPEWFDCSRIIAGDWFVLRLAPAADGNAFSQVPFRRYSDFFKAQSYCPACHSHHYALIDEETGEVSCPHCAGGWSEIEKHRVLLNARDRPRKRVSRGRCAHCGFYSGAPIHNPNLKHNPMAHEFQKGTSDAS